MIETFRLKKTLLIWLNTTQFVGNFFCLRVLMVYNRTKSEFYGKISSSPKS